MATGEPQVRQLLFQEKVQRPLLSVAELLCPCRCGGLYRSAWEAEEGELLALASLGFIARFSQKRK